MIICWTKFSIAHAEQQRINKNKFLLYFPRLTRWFIFQRMSEFVYSNLYSQDTDLENPVKLNNTTHISIKLWVPASVLLDWCEQQNNIYWMLFDFHFFKHCGLLAPLSTVNCLGNIFLYKKIQYSVSCWAESSGIRFKLVYTRIKFIKRKILLIFKIAKLIQ